MSTQRLALLGVISISVMALLGAWLLASQQNGAGIASDTPTILVTIFPLANLAQQVAGKEVDVVLLVPPGANEHSYSLTPQHLAAAQRAQTLVAIGHGLDNHLVSAIERSHSIPVTYVDEGITIRPFEREVEHDEENPEDAVEVDEEDHHDEGEDPHYWLTVPNAQHMVSTLATTLSSVAPEHANLFAERAAAYQERLQYFEQELQTLAGQAPQKHFIAMHNAWSYLADHYGFELVATYEPIEGQQPSLQDLQGLQEVIGRYGITTFFAEPQKVSSAATALLQREFNLTIDQLDPLGGTPGYASYEQMMRRNLEALSSAPRR